MVYAAPMNEIVLHAKTVGATGRSPLLVSCISADTRACVSRFKLFSLNKKWPKTLCPRLA
jgi:hypothetical protein